MGVYIGDNKLVITTERKTFHFDLHKNVDNSLKHEIDSITKHNELSAEHSIKMRLTNYCPNISMKTMFINTENSKTTESHKCLLYLLQRLDLTSSNKHVALQNLSICYAWKNIRQQYKKNKLKIIVPSWNEGFELPDSSYSVSDIQDYIEYIIQKHETLVSNSSIHIYINRMDIS